MRILLTNDDGVNAPGLAVLARSFAEAGHEVIVVAPMTEASGAGAGIGPAHLREHGIHAESVRPDGLDGIEVIAVDALPALIVLTACMGGFGPLPDLVATGINPGRNVGRAIMHSGTVGAALTCAPFGLTGLATSIQAGTVPSSSYEFDDGAPIHFETAAALAVGFANLFAKAPPGTVLNLNVPNLPLKDILGIRRAPLASTGLILSTSVESRQPGVQLDLCPNQPLRAQPDRLVESDDTLTEIGWAVVTPLTSVSEDLRADVGTFVTAALRSTSDLLGT
jgi:5'-nucleotidase